MKIITATQQGEALIRLSKLNELIIKRDTFIKYFGKGGDTE